MKIDRTKLVRLREQRGWNQSTLAALAGLSPGFMSQIEGGSREPSPVTVAEIARVMDIPVIDLVVEPVPVAVCPTCGQRLPDT